jgi:hypothetical protein
MAHSVEESCTLDCSQSDYDAVFQSILEGGEQVLFDLSADPLVVLVSPVDPLGVQHQSSVTDRQGSCRHYKRSYQTIHGTANKNDVGLGHLPESCDKMASPLDRGLTWVAMKVSKMLWKTNLHVGI